jgi:hypothetical protein
MTDDKKFSQILTLIVMAAVTAAMGVFVLGQT